MITNNLFRTSDTALASYLVVSGFCLETIDYSQPRFVFAFPASPEIQEHASKYLTGVALINPAVFDRTTKKLLRIIHRRIQWEED